MLGLLMYLESDLCGLSYHALLLVLLLLVSVDWQQGKERSMRKNKKMASGQAAKSDEARHDDAGHDRLSFSPKSCLLACLLACLLGYGMMTFI